MRNMIILIALFSCLSLSGCFVAAVGAAGAGGGYIYKEQEDKGKTP